MDKNLLNKYNIFITDDSYIFNKLKNECDYVFNLSVYKEIEMFKDDYSNFFHLFFFIFFDNKKIFNFDIFKDREIIEILDNNELFLSDKLKKLKQIKRIYLKINDIFHKSKEKMNRYKILVHNGKNEHFESFISLFWDFIYKYNVNIFLSMKEEQWRELKFEEKSHLYGKLIKL